MNERRHGERREHRSRDHHRRSGGDRRWSRSKSPERRSHHDEKEDRSIMMTRETEERIIAMTEINTTSLPRVVDESEVAASLLNVDADLFRLRRTLLYRRHLRSVVAAVGIDCMESRQAIVLVHVVEMFASPSQSTGRKTETRSTRSTGTGIMPRTRMRSAAF
ncbi:hypothetical protein BDR05DRAFT_676164 [Suillus weaverae]|nr:hypothetical protein BDR05DRAFT_676164 [Suillus weaverae]